MITAEVLNDLISITAERLTVILQNSGYKSKVLADVKFVGITNGGQFCYKVIYDDEGEERLGKVFVTYNYQTGRLTADF